ncbi:MAG: hypothetical protein Q9209_000766 [Squamulea sp. 1 TL-2023]
MSSFPPDKPSISPLITTTRAFILAFIEGSPPSETLSRYFTPTATIHEHGPEWARDRLPFLAKTFSGRSSPSISDGGERKDGETSDDGKAKKDGETMDDYYALLSKTLHFKPFADTLPPISAFAVDEGKGVVTVKMKAGFESVRTGKGWIEEFVYMVGFELPAQKEEVGGRRIQRLDLWADPLSAWVAVGGREGEGEKKGTGGYGGVGAVGGV